MDMYGLIGYPLGHSFSKKYFTEKFKEEGISATYELFPLQFAYEIKNLIKDHPNLKGLNVTIPFKEIVLQQLYNISNIPKGVRACNCIKIIEGKTYGYNTDVMGFESSIMPLLKDFHNKALILGSGGGAQAVSYVFKKNKIKYAIVGRKIYNNVSLTYEDLDEGIIADHPIIVNTTPLGMYPSINTCPAIPYNAIGKKHLLFDLVYNPGKTLFLQKGEERGAAIQNGYEMFTIQAEESWRIWNEKTV